MQSINTRHGNALGAISSQKILLSYRITAKTVASIKEDLLLPKDDSTNLSLIPKLNVLLAEGD